LLRSVGVEKSMKRKVAVEYENEKVRINGHEVSIKLSEAEKKIELLVSADDSGVMTKGLKSDD
jgi:hypothetical protein